VSMAASSRPAHPGGDGAPDGRLIEVRDVVKRFPGVLALKGVSLEIAPGEVHALLGENGAGKSTIIKILSGAYHADEGDILLRGEPVRITDPSHARDLGISTIHQEMTLVPHLSALRNVFLAREPRRSLLGRPVGLVDEDEMERRVRPLCEEFEFDPADLRTPVSEFGALKQQVVEIMRALAFEADLVIMDEPTAALTEHESEALFGHMRGMRAAGISVLWVTHRLEELAGLADRATVLRDGGFVGTVKMASVDTRQLVRMMLGRSVDSIAESFAEAVADAPETHAEKTEVLRVEGIARGNVLRGIGVTLHRGEILGVAGLAGAGRTEFVRAIVGADRIDAGEIYIDGTATKVRSPQEAMRKGIALVPEERKVQAIFGDLSVARNISVGSIKRVLKGGVVVDQAKESRVGEQYVKEMGIRTPSVRQKIGLLSGGNQQKTVVARCLFAQPKVLIFDEPTQGVDIGAKAEIHRLIREYVAEGGSAIVISSETPELITLCDRIVVMRQGRLVGEVTGAPAHTEERELHAKEEDIIHLATGGTDV
jgi:ABC-type sugar transport system ATPase subunit